MTDSLERFPRTLQASSRLGSNTTAAGGAERAPHRRRWPDLMV